MKKSGQPCGGLRFKSSTALAPARRHEDGSGNSLRRPFPCHRVFELRNPAAQAAPLSLPLFGPTLQFPFDLPLEPLGLFELGVKVPMKLRRHLFAHGFGGLERGTLELLGFGDQSIPLQIPSLLSGPESGFQPETLARKSLRSCFRSRSASSRLLTWALSLSHSLSSWASGRTGLVAHRWQVWSWPSIGRRQSACGFPRVRGTRLSQPFDLEVQPLPSACHSSLVLFSSSFSFSLDLVTE